MAKQGAKAAVPRLRFPEFRETSGWSAKILGDEGDFLSPLMGKTAQNFGTGTAKYVTYMNVFANTFTDMATLGIVDVGSGESQNAIEAGDVLFTVSSETPEEVGMSSVVIDAVPNCYVNSFCAMFRFTDGGQPNLHFLGYSLRRPFARHHFVKRAQGSTRFNLSKSAFRSLPLALPSPAEQQKIADCLTSLDEVIVAQGRKVEALKAHKRGLMQQLFPREGETRPRLRFPEFEDAPEWDQETLGETADVLMCKRIFASETNVAGEVPFYKIGTLGGVPDAYISREIFEDYRARYNFPRVGEILITCSGTVGKCLRYDGSDSYFQDSNIVWIDNPTNVIRNDFLFALVSNVDWSKLNSTTITRIYGPDLRGLSIKYPKDGAEQKRIADFLSSLDTQITAESDQIAALKTHKQGLMQQLFPAPDAVRA